MTELQTAARNMLTAFDYACSIAEGTETAAIAGLRVSTLAHKVVDHLATAVNNLRCALENEGVALD